jgi:predicted lipase
MPINHQLRTIFIHIPKTAGTSIEYALGMHGDLKNIGVDCYTDQQKNKEYLFGGGLQHLEAKQIKQYVGKDIFEAYFKFSIVRNPYDRLVSFFAWLDGKWKYEELLSIETFRNYLAKSTKAIFKGKNLLPKPQYEFLVYKKNILADVILRFEQLAEELELLSEHLNKQITLEHRMQSIHKNYSEYFDKESIEIVKRIYRKDFEYFNYNVNEI